ncbi:MAG: copper resistance protein NlpE N-terminal domain-containing protein [Moraxellaceae bacterium]|nr:copper resistance protein NlpE N-terminal domain-containing protein [Moraxellaceae bacterium]
MIPPLTGALLLSLTACQTALPPTADLATPVTPVPVITPPVIEPPAAAPATGMFSGLLPCADCGGIRTTLQLRPDARFLLREVYEGRGTTSDFGMWSEAAGVITLQGASGEPRRFRRTTLEVLRQLDTAGLDIDSTLPYELKRDARMLAVPVPLMLSALFTYKADSPRLRDCRTGLDLPVAMAADYLALEREYLKANRAGAGLSVRVEATLEMRPSMEEGRVEESWVIQRHVGLSAACEPPH